MLKTIQEALEIIYQEIQPTKTKMLPLENAAGYILAQDIVATHNLPPFNNSAMDGYAVLLQDADKEVKVSETIFAGDNSQTLLKPQEAIKIMTGARVPQNTEAIIPKEDTTLTNHGVKLPKDIKQNQHIRFMGEDIEIGMKLLTKGEKINAHAITLLASQGISHIKVYKKPRVAVFASGSELKMHFETLKEYQLYNTNSPTFLTRLEELGCEVEFIGSAQDSLEDLYEHIESALDCDFIITSGGVSVGDADYTKEAFKHFNNTILFDKVAIKPGKPTTFGMINNTAILNLPGNPLAAALNFEIFARSIVLALSGNEKKYLSPIVTKLAQCKPFKINRATVIPGYFDGEKFNVCTKFAPGMISPLAKSNSFIITTKQLQEGDEVRVIPIEWNFSSKEKKELLS